MTGQVDLSCKLPSASLALGSQLKFHSWISKCWKSLVRTIKAPRVCPAPPVVSASWRTLGKSNVINALPEVGAFPILWRKTQVPSKSSGNFWAKTAKAFVPEVSIRKASKLFRTFTLEPSFNTLPLPLGYSHWVTAPIFLPPNQATIRSPVL